jgi:integrase
MLEPTTLEEDDMARTHVRALDSRGRPVPGLYVRDGRFVAGYSVRGRWTLTTLRAETLTEARRERESLLAAHREGRLAARSSATFADVFEEWQASRRISERTAEHERCVRRRYLSHLDDERVQDVTPSDVARLLRDLRASYSEWTCVHAYKVLRGVFGLALRRGLLTRDPMDGLAPHERPKQENARPIARLDTAQLEALVSAGTSERWRAMLALAAFAGLRTGEIRALRWGDIDLEANVIRVSRSALADGRTKAPKTRAGARRVPLLPECRRHLVAWRLRSPSSAPQALVMVTATGAPVAPENLRRELARAKRAAKLSVPGRLSLHALRHSFASYLVTVLELPPTTAAEILGHADPSTTLRLYARDARDERALVEDVLARAAAAG